MALRHLAAFFIPLALFSAPLDFKSCQLKYQVSSIKIGNTHAFAVDSRHAIFYSKEAPTSCGLIKRDPFLGLNLVESPHSFKHTFAFYDTKPKNIAAVLPHRIIEGELLSEQIGLNTLAQFSRPLPENAIITGICCGIIGISTPDGVIDKAYIHRFLQNKEVVYSDIGIRLADSGGVRVVEVNPFFENSPFLSDDLILSMNGKKARNAAQVSREILFSVPGSLHRFVVLREKKELKLEASMHISRSGGLKPDSFFDLFGVELDEKLLVREDCLKYELKKGDRLLRVMNKDVTTLSDVRRVLSQEKKSQNTKIILLIKRSGFDFFIHFPKP